MEPLPNNYPDQFSEEERQVVDTISERRRKYLEKYGAAEDFYIRADKNSKDYTTPSKATSEVQVTKDLFK